MLVLAYHSHNVSGPGYAANDHVAFAQDLEALHAMGMRIAPLREVVEALREGRAGQEKGLVALTFDDGPVFDVEDFDHPSLGPQRSFLNAMRDFRARHGPGAQPGLHATSFVIASPRAREAMERAPDCGYPERDGWLAESWWNEAIDTGLMGIGNHSWDHVHHAADVIATSSQERDDFGRVTSYPDADQEIRRAGAYINERVGGRCEMFAFPFGHANEYLVRDYLPHRAYEHGMVAAFGTGGRAVRDDDPVWNIPRAVCGDHWKSPEGLAALLRG